MQQIALAQAAEGMVLAKDVEIEGGRVLCGKGTVLTASIIERIARMDISHIRVEGHPVPEKGGKSLKERVYDIEERYRNVRHIKPLMYLKKRVQERLIASMSPGGGQGAKEESGK